MGGDTYDYIVVGAGSAGGIVASRLSEGGKARVLCLEAGTKGANYILTRPPAGSALMFDRASVNWRYCAEPHDSTGGRAIFVPRGKILGGSGALNATVFARGLPLDYDTWAQMGCRGWSHRDVLPYLRKIEDAAFGDTAHRGRAGPISVSQAEKLTPLYDMFIAAAQARGIDYNPDYNGATQEGVALMQYATRRGRRQTTGTRYLQDAMRRPNLTVHGGAEVEALLLEGKRCTGLRYRRNGALHEVRAAREVIVSAGTANSPKLLELSGIGNPDILTAHGIAPRHELPGVGENLRDHFSAALSWRFNRPGLSERDRGLGLGLAREILRWGLFGRGLLAHGLSTMLVSTRSEPRVEEPNILLLLVPHLVEKYNGENRRMSKVDGFFLYAHVMRTESTGSIHLRSADPAAPPVIAFRFLQTDYDRRLAVAAVRRAREIVAQEPLAGVIAEELMPGPAVQSDAEILDAVRRDGLIMQHMSGTCRMGQDPMAVVDERLRVRGIAGLRVADASVMPTMISGTTAAPVMMIGEKCADMVLEDAAAG